LSGKAKTEYRSIVFDIVSGSQEEYLILSAEAKKEYRSIIFDIVGGSQ
jgi:hypothetical protein